jgi:hypothetical protein
MQPIIQMSSVVSASYLYNIRLVNIVKPLLVHYTSCQLHRYDTFR